MDGDKEGKIKGELRTDKLIEWCLDGQIVCKRVYLETDRQTGSVWEREREGEI